MPRFNESAAVRPVIMRFVEEDEVVVAEGRSNVILPHHPRGNVLNRSYLVVTTKRFLWVNVGASIKPTRVPFYEVPLTDIVGSHETRESGRAEIHVMTKGGETIRFGFSRPQARAAVVLRDLLHPTLD